MENTPPPVLHQPKNSGAYRVKMAFPLVSLDEQGLKVCIPDDRHRKNVTDVSLHSHIFTSQ